MLIQRPIIGQQSGVEFENAILEIDAFKTPDRPVGHTTIFGYQFDTTGMLGMSGSAERPSFIVPAAVTFPSFHDLGTGRIIHFFFCLAVCSHHGHLVSGQFYQWSYQA